MADTGNGATIAFGTSGFTANFTELAGPTQTRPKVSDSHLGTINFETSIPGDLVEPGDLTAEFQFDPDEQPPISAVAESITVTYPIPTGLSNGATLIGTGYVSEWTAPTLRNNELMLATMTVSFDGKTDPAWSDAT